MNSQNSRTVFSVVKRLILLVIRLFHLDKPNFWRYFCIMLFGIICDTSVFQIAVYNGIPIFYSGLIGGGISVVIVYVLLQKYFHDMEHCLYSFLVFIIYTGGSIGLFSWFIHLINLIFGFIPIISKMAILPVSFVVNYFVNHFILSRIYKKLQKKL
jgi:putative flippase GtrA